MSDEIATAGINTITNTETSIYVTASILLEYLYCPRFIYFMNCLCIDQNEDKRYKVLKGREAHEDKENTNTDYLRKKIGCMSKEIGVFLASKRYGIKGIVDEVLTFSDETMGSLDYKYAEYKDTLFQTHSYQAVFYGLLIKENYGKEVNRGYICYVRSKHYLKEVVFRGKDFDDLLDLIGIIVDITQKGYYPNGTKSTARCIDCCYRNICV
ncbi:MAG: CRISPR-associated protein Cas4 [bacterium]